ncbi:MAG: hypothetical protein ACYC7A_05155 [Thermoanaerobaculia bacterium]
MRMFSLLLALLLAACATAPRPDEPLILVRDHPELSLALMGSDGTYLGCLSCDGIDQRSIINRKSIYGSEAARDSIFNGSGPFGSKLSQTSACNPRATEPPAIVDANGREYGHLTMNAAHPEAIRDPKISDWLRRVCMHEMPMEMDEGCGCPVTKP